MGPLQRLRIVWFAILAFLPVYGVVGVVLRARMGAGDPDALGVAHLVFMALFALLAVVARPLLVRGGVHPAPASFVAWSAAEAVAIVGLVGWIESGDPRAYALSSLAAVTLLVVLFPRSLDVDPPARPE